MSLVLAIEPDGAQAEILRRVVSHQADVQLIVVTSAYAATTTMNRRVPDLLLVGASLGPKAQEVVDRFRSVSGTPNPQILQIPTSNLTDPEIFGAEIAACLARAGNPQGQSDERAAPAPVTPPIVRPDTAPRSDTMSWTPDTPVDAEVHYAELALVQAQAEARLASELERVRQEVAEQRAAELARLQEEADAQRHAEVAQARAAAAAEAHDALAAEVAKARGDAEQTLNVELARVRAEATERLTKQLAETNTLRAAAVEQAQIGAEQARVAAEAAAARAVEAEVARVREESDARLEAELARARQDAEDARRAQQQAQANLEAARETAAREARAATEEAAARSLEAEVERVRTQAEARLQEELARVRADAEEARTALQQAEIDREAARDAAARDARAAAEAAAARAYEVKAASLQSEAEARLRAELERVRQDTERARLAGQSEMELIRQDAEREARARAEAMLRTEIERARAEADARLASEVAEVRADAERHRAADLAVIQAELDLAREAAHEIAHAAAAGAISAEVTRAEISIPMVTARVAAETAGRLASAASSGAAGMLRMTGGGARTVWERLPARTVPSVAALLLVATAALLVDVRGVASTSVSSLGRTLVPIARSAQATATKWLGAASPRSPAVAPREDSNPTPTSTSAVAGTSTETPGTERGTGMLAVFSRVPLDLYVSGRRIGTTDDGRIVIAPGRYRVGLVNTRLNYRGEIVLDVRPFMLTSHTVSLPNGLLQVNTEPGAEVWIEGDRAGLAPLGAVPVQIGTREVVVRHPDLGERRETVEVRYGETTQITIARRENTPGNAYPLPRLDQAGPPVR